jgi:hypothetical protein
VISIWRVPENQFRFATFYQSGVETMAIRNAFTLAAFSFATGYLALHHPEAFVAFAVVLALTFLGPRFRRPPEPILLFCEHTNLRSTVDRTYHLLPKQFWPISGVVVFTEYGVDSPPDNAICIKVSEFLPVKGSLYLVETTGWNRITIAAVLSGIRAAGADFKILYFEDGNRKVL